MKLAGINALTFSMRMVSGLTKKNAILDQIMIFLLKAQIQIMLSILTDGAKHAQSSKPNAQNVITKKVVLFASNNLATSKDTNGQQQELEKDTESVTKQIVL